MPIEIGARDILPKKKFGDKEFTRPRSNSLVLSNLPNKKLGIVNLNVNKSTNESEDLFYLNLLFNSLQENNLQVLDFLLKNLNGKEYLINAHYKVWNDEKCNMNTLGPMTLLAKASYLNQLGSIIVLINRGADINQFNGICLRVATQLRHIEIVQYLISSGMCLPKFLPNKFMHPLSLAVKNNDIQLIDTLLLTPTHYKTNLDQNVLEQLLIDACEQGNINIVNLVIEKIRLHDFKIQFEPKYKPLDLALQNHHLNIVRLLLDKLFDPIPSPTISDKTLSPVQSPHLAKKELDSGSDINLNYKLDNVEGLNALNSLALKIDNTNIKSLIV